MTYTNYETALIFILGSILGLIIRWVWDTLQLGYAKEVKGE